MSGEERALNEFAVLMTYFYHKMVGYMNHDMSRSAHEQQFVLVREILDARSF